MVDVGRRWGSGGAAFLASPPGGIDGNQGWGVSPTASPVAALEVISEGTGFLLIAFMLVGVGGSRAGQTQASENESWEGCLSEDAVTTSSVVSGGEGGA